MSLKYKVQNAYTLFAPGIMNVRCNYWSSIEYLMNCTILHLYCRYFWFYFVLQHIIPSWICHHFCNSCVSWPWPFPATPPQDESRKRAETKSVREKGGAIFGRLRDLWEEQRKRFGLEIFDGKSIVSKTIAIGVVLKMLMLKMMVTDQSCFYAFFLFVFNSKW